MWHASNRCWSSSWSVKSSSIDLYQYECCDNTFGLVSDTSELKSCSTILNNTDHTIQHHTKTHDNNSDPRCWLSTSRTKFTMMSRFDLNVCVWFCNDGCPLFARVFRQDSSTIPYHVCSIFLMVLSRSEADTWCEAKRRWNVPGCEYTAMNPRTDSPLLHTW